MNSFSCKTCHFVINFAVWSKYVTSAEHILSGSKDDECLYLFILLTNRVSNQFPYFMDSAAESCLNAMLGQLSQEPEEAPILIPMPKLRDCAGDKQIAPHTTLCIGPP